MGKSDYDFSGWATRNDIRCADGLTIRRDAFKDCDGVTVPIVWSHIHNDPEMVLGHALLENHPEGVRMYGKFNNTSKGQQTKALVECGDVVGLSIWANNLKKNAGDVLHGVIREVSVVLAGANPGAYIDTVILAHSGDGHEISDNEEFDAVITTGEPIELFHSEKEDEDEEEKEEVDEKKETADDEKESEAESDNKEEEKEEKPEPKKKEEDEDKLAHEDKEGEPEMAEEKKVNGGKAEDEETIEDVFNTLSDKQKNVVYALIGQALEDAKGGADEDEEEEEVKHNVFDVEEPQGNYLSHEDMQVIFADAKRLGSLKDAVEKHMEDGVLAHAVYNHDDAGNETTEQTYGMADVNWLFPEARTLNNIPEFIKRNDDWVTVVINGTHHTPFSRIKSVFADITNDEARARGYVKGNLKVNEVFSLLKRSTDPQTIYKKQKMDRDDIIDITDFDVVAWLRGEMRMMLNEEIARAILIGDGRLNSDDDKIKEDHVRPIANEADLYTIKVEVEDPGDPEVFAKNIIKAAIRARKDYKGSGNPTMFMSESLLTEMMLLEDGLGHPLYTDEAALARRMRVSRIVSCPVLDNHEEVYAIIVNLSDYNVGADKGGAINMFEDFDIDYNQQKYLIETRISGALIRPYSAIVLKKAEDDGNNG